MPGLIGIHAGTGRGQEDWRGLVRTLQEESALDAVTVFPFVKPFSPLRYYADGTDLRAVADAD